MADITKYLKAIKEAIYGEQVRDSIHDAIEVINDVADQALEDAEGFKDSAKAYSETAATSAEKAEAAAETAQEYGSPVSVTQVLEEGTHIADIQVGDKTTAVYAPEGGSSAVPVCAYRVTITEEDIDGTNHLLTITVPIDKTFPLDIYIDASSLPAGYDKSINKIAVIFNDETILCEVKCYATVSYGVYYNKPLIFSTGGAAYFELTKPSSESSAKEYVNEFSIRLFSYDEYRSGDYRYLACLQNAVFFPSDSV